MKLLSFAWALVKFAWSLAVTLERYIVGHAKQGALIASCVLVSVLSVIYIPDLHQYYIGVYSGSKVLLIWTDSVGPGRSGGTGFHVRAPSGKTYLITNKHVCILAKDGEHLFAQYKDHMTKVKIVKMIPEDICVLEPVSGVRGFRTAGTWRGFGKIYTFGFPGLDDYVYSEGYRMYLKATVMDARVVHKGETEVDIREEARDIGFRMPTVKSENCIGPNQFRSFENFRSRFQGLPDRVLEVCHTTLPIVYTTMRAIGGASGSPVINKFGQVVGVVTVQYNDLLLAGMIPVEYLKKALEGL